MRLLACAMCVACGDSHSGGLVDAIAGDASQGDSSSPACDVTKPFGSPTPVDGVNTSENERWGWLTADQRTLYFARSPAAGTAYDLFTATRSDANAPFANVMPLDSVNTVDSEARPVLTGDGLKLYMETVYSSGIEIEVSTRSDSAAAFSSHMVVPVIDTSASEFNPWISEDDLVLYFTSDRDGFNDIFRSTRASASSDFDPPAAVAELNSFAGDYMGALSRDGLEIFIGSSRDTNGANGDIFHATRASTTDPFDAPTKVTELSGASTGEFPSWVSADRCWLLFFSDRSATQDLWIATRPL